jgi:predicted transglutaminase-like cysteine proteinase
MVTEIIPDAYDIFGKRTSYPRKKRFGSFAPNALMGRHVTQPLTIQCKNLEEVQRFLNGCRYVADQQQFGVRDFWMPPEEFEVKRRGDCDDFALWVWRQLISMGKSDARFVVGLSGRYGGGHAWVTFVEGNRAFLVEPMAHRYGKWLPRLDVARYVPGISVSWDGKHIAYFEHERRTFDPPLLKTVPLISEWLLFRVKNCPHFCYSWMRYWFSLAWRCLRSVRK